MMNRPWDDPSDPPSPSALQWRKRRATQQQKLWERSEGRCGICGEPIAVDDVQADHIIPIMVRPSGVQPTFSAELRAAHASCNVKRGKVIYEALRSQVKPCVGCGQPFAGIPMRLYCSTRCRRQRAWQKRRRESRPSPTAAGAPGEG